MTPPALPVDEAARLEALRGRHLLDTSPEERFDRITRTAAQLFGVSTSVISLVDAERQWFKSRFGLDAAETPRDVSFCGHAILQDDVFVVPDALQDARFADNPLVLGDPKIRFYAGTPLRSKSGAAVGTLCLIDSKPREFSEADRKLLTGLAHWAEQTLTRTEQASLVKRAGRWWTGTIADITARKRAEERIELLATQDPLTSLPNRRVLTDRLNHAMLSAERKDKAFFALLFIDLDRFKIINDSFGHNVGDQLLKQVAERITGAIRKGDTLGRLGGDEFALLLEHLHSGEAAGPVARKIIEAFALPYDVKGHMLNVSCSIGISVFPSDTDDAAMLLRNADLAMYSAKEHGRNTYQYFSQEMNQRAIEKLTLERALRDALEAGQFELYYQPKFNLPGDELTGMEALLRWRHPQQGLISPARFIPIAEETMLIVRLGDWVLRQACAQAASWMRRGHAPISVAVNLSVVQFNQNLVASVGDALRASGLEPHYLEVEITENVLMRDVDENIEILRQLSALGVRIAIDDFGTGYSSLSYLRYFKLDTIKIDQSFVRDMVTSVNDASIVSAIIALAHGMKMNVVAEGVESVEQKRALGEMGCDHWQGYFNCAPLAAEEFERRFLLG